MSYEETVLKLRDIITWKTLALIIGLSMTIGAANYKLDNTAAQLDTVLTQVKASQTYMLGLQAKIFDLTAAVGITNNNLEHVVKDVGSLSDQVSKIQSQFVKIRK